MKPITYKDLAKTTETKPHGAFFKVHFHGHVETMWGETKKELAKHLNKIRCCFKSIEPLH